MRYKIATLAAAAIAFGGVQVASAADMAVKARPMAAPVATYSWTGCYIDGGIGYGMYNQDSHSEVTATTVPIGVEVTNGGRGWLGRLGGGCDYQFASSWVIGAFGDFDFMHLHGT